jgi:hypothetical protein
MDQLKLLEQTLIIFDTGTYLSLIDFQIFGSGDSCLDDGGEL